MLYRILSLDGGGVRGVLTARILHRILKTDPNFLKSVDLYAGTSTGSILSAALASGMLPSRIVNFYRESGPKVFSYSLISKIRGLWGLRASRYNPKHLEKALFNMFGNSTLDSISKRLLVASFQLDSQNPLAMSSKAVHSWKAKFFHNFPTSGNTDLKLEIKEVVMRSCAAPIYFPIHNGFIDGGMAVNSPSVCAMAHALRAGNNLSDLRICSLGTGDNPMYINAVNNTWGLLQWNTKVVEILFDSGVGLADYQCREILGDSYLRFNPELGMIIGLDATDKIDKLVEIADQTDLTPILTWIRSTWRK